MTILLAAIIVFQSSDLASSIASRGGAIEEVLAVVGETPILASDLALAETVALLEPLRDESPELYRQRLLEARIRLEIQFRDLEESGLLYRLDIDVEGAVSELTPAGLSPDSLKSELSDSGLAPSDLRELALRVASANAYVNERLRPRVSITLQEIETAYHELVAEHHLDADGAAPPLAELREQIHRLLVERKLNSEIEDWLAQARSRLEVLRFVP